MNRLMHRALFAARARWVKVALAVLIIGYRKVIP